MLPEGVAVRPMESADIDDVIALINEIDEDDAEAAQESYEEFGLQNQFVLTEHDKLLGVTGYRQANGADQTYWLSWTYLSPEKHGQGYGKSILNSLLDHLKSTGARKIFVSTSDYKDEEDDFDVYQAARKMYESVGFKQELRHPDYYDEGESEFVYGLRLKDAAPSAVEPDDTIVEIEAVLEIDETDDAYYIEWRPKSFSLFGSKNQVEASDFEEVKDFARQEEARCVFVSFPSNLDSVLPALTQSGFIEEGRLKDYYRDGVDEIHFRCNI